MQTPYVIDLSHHNVVPESLVPAKQAGIMGVIHKLTQGESYVDPKAKARFALAKQAGLLWGVYHYLTDADPERQADFFLQTATKLGMDENTLMACDHEEIGVSLDNLKRFLALLDGVGLHPILYSGSVLKEQLKGKADPVLSGYRLWIPHYTSNPQPTLPPGFSSYWLWQYTDKGTVPGINYPVDLNTGDPEAIKKWSGLMEKPEPTPAPKRYTVVLTSDSPITVENQ